MHFANANKINEYTQWLWVGRKSDLIFYQRLYKSISDSCFYGNLLTFMTEIQKQTNLRKIASVPLEVQHRACRNNGSSSLDLTPGKHVIFQVDKSW